MLSSLSREDYESVKNILSDINKKNDNSEEGILIRSRYKLFKDVKSKINVFEVDESEIASVLSGYEEGTWFKSKDNHDTALSQLQNIYRTIEDRNAPTTVHRASLSFQACYLP